MSAPLKLAAAATEAQMDSAVSKAALILMGGGAPNPVAAKLRVQHDPDNFTTGYTVYRVAY
jgi:hypothetical protein